MTYMSKSQLRQHLLNAPPGTTPGGIIAALRQQGVRMEGDPMAPAPETSVPGASSVEEASFGGFVKNIANSTFQMFAQPLMHPIQTAEALTAPIDAAATYAVKKTAPLFGRQLSPQDEAGLQQDVQMSKALGQTIADTPRRAAIPIDSAANAVVQGLGKLTGRKLDPKTQATQDDNLKQMYENPAGIAADIATVAAPVGAGMMAAGSKGGTIAGIGADIAKGGEMINPANIVGRGISKTGQALKKPITGAAERLYQSALKPTKTVLNDFPNVVKTGLNEGVPVSGGGWEKVQTTIDELNTGIAAQIDLAGAENIKIPVKEVIPRLEQVRNFFKNSIGGEKYVDDIDELARSFRKAEGKEIPVGRAQELKKNTYSILRKAYGELKAAEVEGKKALARGLKEEIASRVPEVAKLNARESQLIGLEKAMEDFARRSGNTELFGLSPGMGVGVGAVKEGMSGAFKGGVIAKAVKSLVDNPYLKSQLAIHLDEFAKGTSLSKDTASFISGIANALRLGEQSQ